MNESSIYEIRLKDRFSSPLSSMESRMNRFEGKVHGLKNVFSGLSGSIIGAFSGGLVASSIESLLSRIKDFTFETIQAARQFDNLKSSIEFASGADAVKNIDFIDNAIERLGLDINSTYKGYKVFQGALMGTTLEGEKGRDIFNAVSEASSVMKLSAEQTEGTFLALGQMISKGNVQAEELRGQLGERLPGAFNIFARALGVTTQKLNKMLQDGEVLAETALPLFAAELRKTFSPGVIKASDSFNANMNRFTNFLFRAKMELGFGLMPYVNDFVKVIPKLDFSPLLFTFRQLKDEVAGLVDVFDQIGNSLGVTFTTFEKFTILLRYMSYLFRVAFTPIRVAVQLFTQLIMLVKNSYGVFEGLGNILVGVMTRDFAQVAKGAIQMKDAIGKLGDEAASSAGQFLNDEKEGWKKIFAPLNDPSKNSAYATGSGAATNEKNTSSAAGKTSTAGVEKIASGTRNIVVNINKLVETVKFEKWNGQSESQLIEAVKKALISSVNDVNIVAQ